jgi:integration host factor subunit beta
MLKSELIERLSEKFTDISIHTISATTSLLVEVIAAAIIKQERVEIRGFGSFSTQHYKPRKAHNPQTGEHFIAPSKWRPSFKAGKGLRERINHKRL